RRVPQRRPSPALTRHSCPGRSATVHWLPRVVDHNGEPSSRGAKWPSRITYGPTTGGGATHRSKEQKHASQAKQVDGPPSLTTSVRTSRCHDRARRYPSRPPSLPAPRKSHLVNARERFGVAPTESPASHAPARDPCAATASGALKMAATESAASGMHRMATAYVATPGRFRQDGGFRASR